jgi:protein-disulfide isomerase
MKRNLPLVIIGGVLIVAIAVAVIMLRSKQTERTAPFTPQAIATQAPASPAAEPPPTATPQAALPTIPNNVAVTVEEYGDYQCPPCGLLHPEIKKIQYEYGNRVNFVFRNLPLTKLHKNALVAAQAAEAARLQNRFWQMHDRIYESQNDWKDQENPRATFTEFARELGLDISRFARDMDGAEVKSRLAEDQQHADSLEVVGTPTIFVDGRQLKSEVTTPEGIRKGINIMLTHKATGQ